MIYVVIPVFNRLHFTIQCLDSLRKQTSRYFRTVVVDDGSTDGTSETLEKSYPEVILLKGTGDLFWTASVNMGVRYALKDGASQILTMNNDVAAPEDFIENMIKWADKRPRALIGALEISALTGKIISGGEKVDWITGKNYPIVKTLPPEKQKGLHEVSHLPGRGLLIPREVFEKIGMFNEKLFPHYMADFDFTRQAYKGGFELYCNYDAKLYTYPEASGDSANRKNKNIRNYYNHLFTIKGGGNLKNFTNYAIRNCPKPYLPGYLIAGYARRIFGYLVKKT